MKSKYNLLAYLRHGVVVRPENEHPDIDWVKFSPKSNLNIPAPVLVLTNISLVYEVISNAFVRLTDLTNETFWWNFIILSA